MHSDVITELIFRHGSEEIDASVLDLTQLLTFVRIY